MSRAQPERGARPLPVEDGLLERFNALTRQLDRVEQGLWALAEAKASTEALMERVQALSAGAGEGEAVVGRTDQDEERCSEDGLGVLTALGVAAPQALVMFVPELP